MGPGPVVVEWVPVAGGQLGVHAWPATGGEAPPVVVALHGITANGLSWADVASEIAGRVTLMAPDLRGRACSRTLPGPYGLPAHVDDLLALLDHHGLERVVVAGHSMGAFVAALAAVRHPDRVAGILLADGGVGFPVPTGRPIEEVLDAVIGPAMQRLDMSFADHQAYLDFWDSHPALTGELSAALADYLIHDLVHDGQAFRSTCRKDAVMQDATDVVTNDEVIKAATRLKSPATLLWAPRGVMNQPGGLFNDDLLTAAGVDRSVVTVECVDEVNHYTLILGEQGAGRVAAAILELVDQGK